VHLDILNGGLIPYGTALNAQLELVERRRRDEVPDTLILLEHPHVITTGKRTDDTDILLSRERLKKLGVEIFPVGRGGQATYHGPGQLVGYIIVHLQAHHRQVKRFVRNIEEVLIRLLSSKYGIEAERDPDHTGVWVGNSKIAAVGIQIREKVTFHGFALNVNTDLRGFSWIVPCGIRDRGVTSIERLLGRRVPIEEVKAGVHDIFPRVFGYDDSSLGTFEEKSQSDPKRMRRDPGLGPGPKPPWLRVPIPGGGRSLSTERLLRELGLHTVCREANCPNRMECFSGGTATFLILGDVCTRRCAFCNVGKGIPQPPDPKEPAALAEAVTALGLSHVVITSVTRDDLPDGGAAHFAECVRWVRQRSPDVSVELLIPDLRGRVAALGVVMAAGPDVLNHNIETVPRLYPQVRPGADYTRSLGVLTEAKRRGGEGLLTKSGLMVGLGETTDEVRSVLRDLREAGCDLLTVGQYMAPSKDHTPVREYVAPETFDAYAGYARKIGFRGVASAPLVRSSYRAAEMLASTR
jgi:lipoyl synthase